MCTLISSKVENPTEFQDPASSQGEAKISDDAEVQLETFERCYHYNLPAWLRDNDYLISWHRPPNPSYAACLKSIFRIHSETGNIWSHLIGCGLFATLAYYFFTQPPDVMDALDKVLFGIFFGSAVLCLSLSSAYHIVCCHSDPVIKFFSRLDFCGIAILTLGSFIPWLHYGFYNFYFTKMVYLVMISAMTITCIAVSMSERFRKPEHRAYRYALFALFGLSGVIPILHFLMVEGLSKVSLISWLILSGAMYLLGGAIYAMRIPERYYPGKFDIWFHSHQIFHILVIAAAVAHYISVYEMAFIRLSTKDKF